jgi:RNA polymerase sigma-70 factor (ECF subfamily)
MMEISPPLETKAQSDANVEECLEFLRKILERICPKDLGIQVDDVAQDASVKLLRALQSERKIDNLKSYICTIALNARRDAVSRVRARREEQPFWDNNDENDDGPGNLDPVSPGHSPERMVQLRELRSIVMAEINRLPDNQRRALGLHLKEMSDQEVANLMGWTEDKARNLIYRGKKKLRKRLRARGIDYEID